MKKSVWKDKKSRIRSVAVIGIVLLLVMAVIFSNPKFRTTMFVHSYHELIEESLALGHGVPADETMFWGYEIVNSWDKEHKMTEFIISAKGDTYYGCYYSQDDVPLAFQNTEAELVQDGHDYWEWKAEGDNHGSTSKIMESWYYFEASF